MNSKLRTLYFLLLATGVQVQAANLDINEFPAALQACNGAGCQLSTDSSVDFPSTDGADLTASLFLYLDLATHTQHFLMRYRLLAPSSGSGADLFNQRSDFTGHVWIGMQARYLAGGPHLVTVYTDQVSPEPVNFWYGSGANGRLNFGFTDTDLLAGSGHYVSRLDINNIGHESGDLISFDDAGVTHPAFYPCAAEGCGVSVELNLLHIQYMATGNGDLVLMPDPGPRDALLFRHSTGFEQTGTQAFYVNPVPLSAGVWLLPSGLLSLFGTSRRASV